MSHAHGEEEESKQAAESKQSADAPAAAAGAPLAWSAPPGSSVATRSSDKLMARGSLGLTSERMSTHRRGAHFTPCRSAPRAALRCRVASCAGGDVLQSVASQGIMCACLQLVYASRPLHRCDVVCVVLHRRWRASGWTAICTSNSNATAPATSTLLLVSPSIRDPPIPLPPLATPAPRTTRAAACSLPHCPSHLNAGHAL